MSKKTLIAGVAAVAIVFAGAYFASPLLAANALRGAAQAGDADKLQRLVDFPAVRESLKGQLNTMVTQSIQSDPEMQNNPFAGLAAVMAPAIVNQAVDGYVTADGLSAMMAADRPKVSPPGAPAAPKADAPAKSKARFEQGYRDLGTYVVSSVNEADPNARFDFVMHRQGLFGWKLTRIELPKSLMDRPAAKAP